MIPQKQLEILKPLPDQIIRERMVKSKRTISFRKGRLTHRARQWALYIDPIRVKSISEPKGVKWKGNLPMEKRRK